MATIDDQLKHFAVKVNNGSGCIFQPNTEEYTYVLTVKHNLRKKDNKYIADVNRYNLEKGTNLSVREIYTHPNESIDLALIVIDYIGHSDHHLIYSKYEMGEKVKVFGYPQKSHEDKIKTNSFYCNCDLEHEKDISFRIISDDVLYTFNSSTADNVIGFSGSGLFLVEEDNIILKGIFPKLNFSDGAFNSLIAYQIECFDEIVQNNNLKELIPAFLQSFERIKELAFFSLEPHISLVIKDSLENILKSSITPNKIADIFKGGLYVPYTSQYRNKLVNKALWKGWLELLTVLSIVSDKEELSEDDDDFLQKYLKKISLLFSIKEPALSIVIKTLINDESLKSLLVNDACIVINSDIEPASKVYTKTETQRILGNISRASKFERGMMMIDDAAKQYSFSCLHLSYFLNNIGVVDKQVIDDSINIDHVKSIIQNVMKELND